MVSAILRTSITSPLGELGESVDYQKLFAELCMNVYTSIFLKKEVPSYHQILEGPRDLNRVQNPCYTYPDISQHTGLGPPSSELPGMLIYRPVPGLQPKLLSQSFRGGAWDVCFGNVDFDV